jgi:hypothetical protein
VLTEALRMLACFFSVGRSTHLVDYQMCTPNTIPRPCVQNRRTPCPVLHTKGGGKPMDLIQAANAAEAAASLRPASQSMMATPMRRASADDNR